MLSPTCSRRFFVRKKTLSAAARTISSPSLQGGRGAGRARAPEEYDIAPSRYNREPSLSGLTPWYVPAELRGRSAQRRTGVRALLALAAAGLLIAGCGEEKQDAKEPKGTFPVAVERATFPAGQRLAKQSRMTIVVRNAGSRAVPDVSVTVKCKGQGPGEEGGGGGFYYNTSQPNTADPQRPQFVVDKIPTRTPRPTGGPLGLDPLERSSAFVNTYPLGPLGPGRRATFTWDVTAVKAGPYHICWRVNAGLYNKAKAVTASSSPQPIFGQFRGTVERKAPIAEVTPSGKVVEVPEVQPSK